MRVGILALQGAVGLHAEKLKQLGVVPVEVRNAAELDGLSGLILPGGESTAMRRLITAAALWEPLREFTHHRPTWGVCAGAILLARHVSSASINSQERKAERGQPEDTVFRAIADAPAQGSLPSASCSALPVSLQRIDMHVIRNAFGRQLDSFIAPLTPTEHWKGRGLKNHGKASRCQRSPLNPGPSTRDSGPFEGVFIRAPRIVSVFDRARPLWLLTGKAAGRLLFTCSTGSAHNTASNWSDLFRQREEASHHPAGEPVMVQQDHLLASTFHPELTGCKALHQYFLRLCESRRHRQ